jgi:hypothetical protein
MTTGSACFSFEWNALIKHYLLLIIILNDSEKEKVLILYKNAKLIKKT